MLPVLPVVLMASGVAIAGAGVAFGLASHANERDYRSSRRQHAAADDAIDVRDTAHRHARLGQRRLRRRRADLALGATLLIVDLPFARSRERDDFRRRWSARISSVRLRGHFPRTW